MTSQRTLANEAIADILRKAMKSARVPPGTVLLEGPIAALFDSSRTPVKQALLTLEKEGIVRRFDGRGVLAGSEGGPLRIKITSEMLSLGKEDSSHPKVFAWQPFYYDFENTIILRAVFGSCRINELALARHYGISRTVAGDLLSHAIFSGLVSRDDKSRWWINPLDEARFTNLYQLRILLEPAALRSAVSRIPPDVLNAMRQRVAKAAQKHPDVNSAELDRLEEDLHVDLLEFGENSEIMEALKRTRCVLIAGKHIQRAVRGRNAVDPIMDEHISIFDAVAAGDAALAESELVNHLRLSSEKSVTRLRAFLHSCAVAKVSYVID